MLIACGSNLLRAGSKLTFVQSILPLIKSKLFSKRSMLPSIGSKLPSQVSSHSVKKGLNFINLSLHFKDAGMVKSVYPKRKRLAPGGYSVLSEYLGRLKKIFRAWFELINNGMSIAGAGQQRPCKSCIFAHSPIVRSGAF